MQLKPNNHDYHVPVLLQEVLDALQPVKDGLYIDATMGGGGHARAIASVGAKVLAIDHDQDAIDQAKTWQPDSPNVTVAKGSFENLAEIAKVHNFIRVQGILFDLGVSSHQLDEPERGFSFRYDAPLDMRMNTTLAVTAADLVNALSEKELAKMIFTLGEDHNSRRIARAIVSARKQQPIATTTDLVRIITKEVGEKAGNVHSATRTFQALRIAVNSELEVLENALPQAFELLAPLGKLAVISFHSLEDRIVKHAIADWVTNGKGQSRTKKPVEPSEQEVTRNQRARSAKLRVFEKAQ